jgi:hypothetical protein
MPSNVASPIPGIRLLLPSERNNKPPRYPGPEMVHLSAISVPTRVIFAGSIRVFKRRLAHHVRVRPLQVFGKDVWVTDVTCIPFLSRDRLPM